MTVNDTLKILTQDNEQLDHDINLLSGSVDWAGGLTQFQLASITVIIRNLANAQEILQTLLQSKVI